MNLILALDQGTTSSRAMLVDHGGRPVAPAQHEFAQHYPKPGWVEHDPEQIWRSQVRSARECLSTLGEHDRVLALGIANQRETTLLWERASGQPVYPAIVWQDRRTASFCDELRRQGWTSAISERTGIVIDPYFSATKVRWLLDNIAGLRARARRGEIAFGTVDSWLIWRLTGGVAHVTDYSNASRTMLFNINTLDWDGDILAELDIPLAVLPEVRPTSGIVARTSRDALGHEIPITAAAGDQQAAAFGQGCFQPGMAKQTYGTGAFMLINAGPTRPTTAEGLLTTIAWYADERPIYALEGAIFATGAAIQWLRDSLGLISSAAESEALACSVSSTGGVYLVPAFAGLGAPWWDARARGTLAGMTRGTGRAEIVRAALEATAYQTRDVLDLARRSAGIAVDQLRVDGGMVSNSFLMQFQADIGGIPVVRPTVAETTALGAAFLAGLAIGFWEGLDELSTLWTADRIFEPSMSYSEREQLHAGWLRAVERALGWARDD